LTISYSSIYLLAIKLLQEAFSGLNEDIYQLLYQVQYWVLLVIIHKVHCAFKAISSKAARAAASQRRCKVTASLALDSCTCLFLSSTASNTKNSCGNGLQYCHIPMLISKCRLPRVPTPLSGFEAEAGKLKPVDVWDYFEYIAFQVSWNQRYTSESILLWTDVEGWHLS
jgi:hypothetical protein